MQTILATFPDAIVDEIDGEIVVSTGLALATDHDTVIPFESSPTTPNTERQG
jgi:hypothetical protein